jgi:hypothetical protein
MSDPRKGLPSASSMQRIMSCRGSLPLTEQLRTMGMLPEDRGSDDADKGTRIHEILAKFAKGEDLNRADFDSEEWTTAEKLWERAQEIITEFFGDDLSDVEFVVEERLWLNDRTGEKILSGQFDLIGIRASTGDALLIDYKTLFGEHPPASLNWQLRTGAVLIREIWGATAIRIVLLQNAAPTSKQDVDVIDLDGWLEEIEELPAMAKRDPLQVGFTRGHWCNYCPAKLACPKIKHDLAIMEATPEAVIQGASNDQLGELLDRLESVSTLEATAKREADWRLRNGATIPGWKLEASKGKRKITDPAAVGRALIDMGAETETVLGVMSMPVGKAEAILSEVSGKKGKALKSLFEEITDGFVEISEPEPTLKKA